MSVQYRTSVVLDDTLYMSCKEQHLTDIALDYRIDSLPPAASTRLNV